jgi:cell division septation protein DedD
MKKVLVISLVLMLIIFSCSKKEKIPGVVGESIYLAALVENPSDTVGCSFEWQFTAKPLTSNLDVLALQPNSNNYYVHFVPDVDGEYQIRYRIIDPSGKIKTENQFVCSVIKTSKPTAPTPEPEPVVETPKPKVETPSPVVTETATPKEPEVIKGENIPRIYGNYTIQMSSWKTYGSAEKAVKRLTELNVNSYIQKAFFDETGETWYRVRSGTYLSYTEAKKALNELKEKVPNQDMWIDFVRIESQ